MSYTDIKHTAFKLVEQYRNDPSHIGGEVNALMESLEESLSPCPMCNGVPRIETETQDKKMIGQHFISCECGIKTERRFDLKELFDIWNRRSV